jgi:hypothetical protein
MSKAASTFTESFKEVGSLRDIHERLTGKGRGYRPGMEVLNKSAIVLLCAIWEAYCEDVADEGLKHLLAHSSDYSILPKVLQKRVAKELKDDPHELSPWKLAGGGWKTLMQARLAAVKERRDFDWNNPKAEHVDRLFEEVVGITRISGAWHWKHVSPTFATKKLDQLVALRGDIAHRGKAGEAVIKSQVAGHLEHVRRLVVATDSQLRDELRRITGVAPWR